MRDSFESRLFDPSGFLATFEQLGHLVPAVLVICAAPFYMHHAICNKRCIQASSILFLKLAIVAAWSAVQVKVVFNWWETSPRETRLVHGGAVASYMSMPSLALIVLAGHLYSVQSAPFLSVFLALTFIVDIGAFPTYFYPASLGQSANPRMPILALKILLLGLEQVPKHGQIIPMTYDTELGTSNNGIRLWQAPLRTWIESVLILGFRTKITKEELPEMDKDLAAEHLYFLFKPQWEAVDKASPYALVKAILYTVPGLYLANVPPLLLHSLFRLSQPFLIRDVLVALARPTPSADVTHKLIITTATVYLGIATSSAWKNYSHSRLTMAVRAVVEAAIYNKCLTLNPSSLDMAAVSTIMNNDIQNLNWVIATICQSWSILLDIAFNVTVLASLYGPTAILLVVPALLAGTNAIRVGRREMVDRREWRRRTAAHVAVTSNFLAQIKDIKMLGLGSHFGKRMQQYQKEEIAASLPVRDAESIGFIQGAFTESVTPMVAVAIAMFPLMASQTLSIPDFCAAVGIGLISMQPLAFAVRSMSDRLRGFDCAHRIQQFLLQRDNQDGRICAPDRLYVKKRDWKREVITRFVVQFIDASVQLDAPAPILHSISIRIPRGRITMLYGRTGTGKTTFLKMIIGQAALNSGTLLVATTSIAYCAQKPWIRNASIRDNIVGQSPFDAQWFDFVLRVCALDRDLARLAYGVLTSAGSDGCNLSAGQRQRISLARALYAKKEIIVVDDIFTSLDKRTSSDIRIRLFAETELLQTHNITLIMTTTMREHLVDADLALEISEHGLIGAASSEGREESSGTLPNVIDVDSRSDENEGPAVHPPPLIGSRPIEAPDRIYGDWSLYRYFLRPAGTLRMLLWTYSVLAAAIVENLPVVFVSFWMQYAPENRYYFLVFAAFSLTNPIFNHFTTITHFYFIYIRTATALYAQVTETTCRATLDYLTSTDTSFLLNKFCQDVALTTETLPLLLMPMTWNFVLLVTNMLAFWLASSSVMLPAILLVCLFALQYFYSRSCRHLRILHGDAGGEFSKQLSDTGAGADHIYSFGWQPAFLKQYYCLSKEKHRAAFHLACGSQWLMLMLNGLAALAATTIVAVTLNSKQESSPAIFAFAMFNVIVFTNNMVMLICPWVSSDAILNGVHRVRTFVNSTPVESDPIDLEIVSPEWARRGKIELSCVTAQYRPIDGARHTALDHVSFTIQPGQIVGISGRTGSGKTSIFLSMLNLIHFEGSIFIDDREIRTLPHELLRSRITIMTQTVLELTGTVRFNMNPFDPDLRPRQFLLTDDMLVGILRRVGLWDHIEQRGGLDVSLHLMRFSNGQKQLFQLARAMLHKQMMRTRIIFIDEGAPNAEIEDHMRQVMREVFDGCTILMVSHRPSLFREADRILTVDRGKACLYEHDRQRDIWSANRWNNR